MTDDLRSAMTLEHLTLATFLIPCVVLLVLFVWLRPALRRINLFNIFFELFTIIAAVVVLAGALVPKFFHYLEDQSPFLIVVSLSALLHAVASVANFIGEVRSDSTQHDGKAR